MVELVDTQDLKSCDLKSRAGSIPALSTQNKKPVSFKTLQVFFQASLAQLVEQLTCNQ